MSTLVADLLGLTMIVALMVVAVAAAVRTSRRLELDDSPAAPAAPAGDRRHGWCENCGTELWGDDLHEVVDGGVDGDGVLSAGELAGGGTAMAAEFCAEHCPGSCRSRCRAPHHRRQVA